MRCRSTIPGRTEERTGLFRVITPPLFAVCVLLFGAVPAMAAPINDDFSARLAITGLTNTVTGSNVDATNEPGEPNHHANAPGGKSVWWTWTAPTNTVMLLDTIGSSFYPLLAACRT